MKIRHLGAVLVFVSLTAGACSQLRGTLFKDSADVPKERVELPADIKHAEGELNIVKEGAVVITLTKNSEIYLDSEILPKDRFVEGLKKSIETIPENKRIVYVKIDVEATAGGIKELLRMVRETGVNRIGFIIKKKQNDLAEAKRPSIYCFEILTQEEVIYPPDEPLPMTKPNPLTLIVDIRTGGALKLNAEDMGTVSNTIELNTKLSEVFEYREKTINKPEVEKTVWLKSADEVKYGDLVKVVDAIVGAGGKPVGLQLDDDKPIFLPLILNDRFSNQK